MIDTTTSDLIDKAWKVSRGVSILMDTRSYLLGLVDMDSVTPEFIYGACYDILNNELNDIGVTVNELTSDDKLWENEIGDFVDIYSYIKYGKSFEGIYPDSIFAEELKTTLEGVTASEHSLISEYLFTVKNYISRIADKEVILDINDFTISNTYTNDNNLRKHLKHVYSQILFNFSNTSIEVIQKESDYLNYISELKEKYKNHIILIKDKALSSRLLNRLNIIIPMFCTKNNTNVFTILHDVKDKSNLTDIEINWIKKHTHMFNSITDTNNQYFNKEASTTITTITDALNMIIWHSLFNDLTIKESLIYYLNNYHSDDNDNVSRTILTFTINEMDRKL